MSMWLKSFPIELQAAIIGAITSIIVVILRDFAAKLWSDRRETQKSAEDVYCRYAEPLGSATTSLMWRLREIFSLSGRASFLIGQEPRTTFEDYKLRSTYYRLAAVFGLVTGLYGGELSFLRIGGTRSIDQCGRRYYKV